MSATHILGHVFLHAAKNPTVQAAVINAGSTAISTIGTTVITAAPVLAPMAIVGYGIYRLLK